MDVNGTVLLVLVQLDLAISSSSNGRERIDVIGTVGLVPLQLFAGISPSSNGRERMDVIGERRHIMQQDFMVTQM